ncbi:hypothetical protein [Arenicella xantha]|uniref:Uncharacterized protein n=1 Tax=Arenicella xantha TaxID=644221 RepID=A0A395JF07_9GAMM|nr:hypothetical protein [Arenicella xantha]RBP48338.1 hypothetical protein DFR28_10867 [Arenicella xantha]
MISQPARHLASTSIPDMATPQENGAIRECNGKICIHIDGYWIRYYPPPPNTMAEKKDLIFSLRRRVFHHTEEGINSPGWRLEIARKYYEEEVDPARKRVKAAMLAGSLFNRATDIFASVVDLEDKGIQIDDNNQLMKQCEACFMEALELGKEVKHFSGEEGVDELWGEPFKAFSFPMDKFFESRYVKLAQTFVAIDKIIDRMVDVFVKVDGFEGVLPMLNELREAAKTEVETMRRDEAIYEVWPRYVAAKEAIMHFQPCGLSNRADRIRYWEDGMRLLHMGKDVISYLSGVRVPMPVTTANYMANCDLYEQNGSLDSEFSIPQHCFQSQDKCTK